ncbi:OmpA family protein [Georgenia sp. AZ-5]|uniref:OmpA family protein n=1 Tax=Georgenia sp. AZ-5 TaxID=3367526 RepID=UPI00375458D9
MRARETEAQGTVGIATDVLFAVDSADLSPDADAARAAAASQLAGADGGALTVVGHTDDVDTDEHNLDLSQRRDQAVAQRLGELVDLPPSMSPSRAGASPTPRPGAPPQRFGRSTAGSSSCSRPVTTPPPRCRTRPPGRPCRRDRSARVQKGRARRRRGRGPCDGGGPAPHGTDADDETSRRPLADLMLNDAVEVGGAGTVVGGNPWRITEVPVE